MAAKPGLWRAVKQAISSGLTSPQTVRRIFSASSGLSILPLPLPLPPLHLQEAVAAATSYHEEAVGGVEEEPAGVGAELTFAAAQRVHQVVEVHAVVLGQVSATRKLQYVLYRVHVHVRTRARGASHSTYSSTRR